MSRVVLVAVIALGLAGCGSKTAHYGKPFEGAAEVTLAAVVQNPSEYYRKTVHLRGKIVRQCPAMGCWFFLEDAVGSSLKVELGDYLPKLPINIGRWAEVEGEVIEHGAEHIVIGTRVTFYDGSQ